MIKTLADIFFLISNSLLIPVMVALLLGLAAAFWLIGKVLRESFDRIRARAVRQRIAESLQRKELDVFKSLTKEETRLVPVLSAVLRLYEIRDDWTAAEKELADVRRFFQNRLDPSRLLMKFGPALGLMGTLIPLGPALVGLAQGDLESMARNLGIAFATTVVGLLVSLIAYGCSAIQKRRMTADLIFLTFAAARMEPKR